MRALLFGSLLALAVITTWSCGNDDEVAPTVLNFNRPIDLAFACYGDLYLTNGGSAQPSSSTPSAQPISACDKRSTAGSDNVPPGQSGGNAAWYAFILQSVPGTVGLAQFATEPASSFTGINDVTVLDADPLTPGKSGITVGEQPVGLVTDSIGCDIVTANAGTCDLSALDITTALNYQADPQASLSGSNYEPVRVTSLPVTNSAGIPLRAKPAAIVSQPAAGTIGVACPATPTGLVYVAYPSCHYVAGIDLASGTVVTGIQFDSNGTPTVDASGTMTCPDECSGGGQVTAGPHPTSLDLQLDPRTQRRALAIGSEDSNIVTIVDLDVNSRPASISRVVLQQDRAGTLGVNQVKISPAIGMGGEGGTINDDNSPGQQMQFVYAIASDETIRVANIFPGPNANVECDTQVDPRYLHDKGLSDISFLSCMPVGGATTPPRRAGAIGPGIQLINRMPAITTTTTTTSTTTNPTTSTLGGTALLTVPMGIDIFQIGPPPGVMAGGGSPTAMVGYFGVITGANGQTYILNVDDDYQADYVGETGTGGGNAIGTAIPYDIANQIRDALPERGALAEEALTGSDGSTQEVELCDATPPDPDSTSGNEGGPRGVDTMVTTLPTNPVNPADLVSTAKSGELPSVRQVLCTSPIDETMGEPVSELSFDAPASVRDAEYPDVMGMIADETWSMTYEGSVSIDTIDTASNGPPYRTSMMQVDATGMYMVDQTTPYCAAGVEPYDILTIRGCDPSLGNADCPPDFVCFVHPDSQVTGVGECMLSSEADRLSTACKEFLVSERRYTIGKTTAGTLTLLPRKHVLRTSPIDGCTSDMQCSNLATYAATLGSPNNPIDDTTPPDAHAWSCAADPDRAPDLDDSGNVIKRCLETCPMGLDSECDPGTVCQNNICMEGIEPPQACVNSPQKYELDVGEAFAVAGSYSGFHHPIIADANGNCIKDPNASPFEIGRLPLRAPPCDPTANALGILPDGTVEANPCETTVAQSEYPTQYVTGTCTPMSAPTNMPVSRQADAIVFRGPAFNLTLVDPTYPGDATCIGDRQGNLGKIPVVPPSAQLSQRITGGFRPLFLDIQPAVPGKVVRGPTESIWVIDTGDYLSTDIDVASTSGKVFRVESQAIGIINVLE